MEELIDNVLGVRISPSLVHFMDVSIGQTYQAKITVQNISRVAKTIKIIGPQNAQFTLSVKNSEKPMAPGLQITATVEYKPSKKEDISDKLLVVVDRDVINVPLLGFTPSCYLEIDPEVNFGNVIANSKVIYKEIGITNHGSSPGTFKLKYNGTIPITIIPTSGTVEPKTTHLVKLELCADVPVAFEEIAKVKLQGREETSLLIKGNFVRQSLELLDLSGKSLKCVHFGAVYFGTSKIQKAVLYNDSPEEVSWVSVLDDNALGAEMGSVIGKSTEAVLQEMNYRKRTSELDVSALLSCFPNQGVLLPFQKTTVTLCFSPKQNEDTGELPSQQDYALFMKFELVGSKDGFLQADTDAKMCNKGQKKRYMELAATGSAFPVTLTFSPGTAYNFKECVIGERIDMLCSLKNESQCLPAVFSFRKISHFHISPANGKIEPGHSQDMVFSFVPHQAGTFKVKQVVDILGPTSDEKLSPLKTKAFHQMKLTFQAVCKPITNKIVMKVNPGITPLVTNPTGQFVQAPKESALVSRMATLSATKTQIHVHQKTNDADNDVLVAFPNDRAASIRPSDRKAQYRTIFTKMERYNYVDADYAYTEEEEKIKQAHKDYYTDYIKSRRERRLKEEKDREFEEMNNDIEIGITPAAGLQPPTASIAECLNEQQKPITANITKGRMLTTRQLASVESRSVTKENNEGLNAMPCTAIEKEDCSLELTPQQLHQVVIGPSTIDFGEICVRSASIKELIIINSLPMYIWVQVEIDCDELQQTSPLSHVVPPMSKTDIPVVFETNSLGKFKKSITYTINNKHAGHILVMAKTVPVALVLSSHELTLKPNNDFLADTGFRSSVRLYNRRNHPAEFSWKPIITEKGIAFSIRPARGVVDAYKDLECEVVWHPGFSSPEIGEFNLCVQQRNSAKLRCIAELGSTSVQFTEQRVLFHRAPLGLTTYKTAIIQNTGMNHAYFQVVDISPLPGMTITPSQGVVPVGGYTTLKIFFTPRAVMKFDTRVEVSVRNAKTLELRIGGSVVPPEVNISVSSFLFPGVYVNATQAIPFLLQNKGAARTKVEFDLSRYEDFSLSFKDESAVEIDPLYPRLYTVDLEEKETLECVLHFHPKEVAAYDFQLPININFTGGVSDADSSTPVTPTHSEKHIVVPRPQMVDVITPACKVNATVLQTLLQFSSTRILFELPSEVFNLGIADDSLSSQALELRNVSKQKVMWRLNLDHNVDLIKNGIFKFSTRFDGPGIYAAEVPVILNDNPDSIYTALHLFGTSSKPKLMFDPPLVILTPVPLDTEVQETVEITPTDYYRNSTLKVEIPEVQLDKGETVDVFSVSFPGGQTIINSNGLSEKLSCRICFRSSSPLRCLVDLVFTDEENNKFPLQVAAVAENCILTVYPYLACHRTDQQVILRSGHNGNGKNGSTSEAVLRPCYIPETPSQSTSSSSLGAITSSTYEESVSEDDNVLGNERTQNGDAEIPYHRTKDKLELLFYPEEDTEEWIFFQKVLATVQTWFSLFGWPSGCNPITIPDSLWSAVCKVKLTKTEGKAMKTITLGKQAKTIYDMLFYLSGQMLPGITASQSLPADPTERVLQLHWQHSTLLTFLKNQGASLPHIKPEYLFEPLDYERWIQVQDQIQKLQISIKKNVDTASNVPISHNAFQSVSKRSWTDVLLQIYKVLILSRVEQTKTDDETVIDCMPKISSEPLSSNIYSTSERILLTWLNVHYEKMRKVTWKNCMKGDVPPTRWIMNFDKDLLDGLVLAAQVAAYCPYLISSHFIDMYTSPESPEQCLHNCLILVNALRTVNLNIDIQATDICDPNPVMMLMLCVYLHETLPLYVPKKTINFDGPLHQTISRQVRLKNPSSKPLVYNATVVGRESADFSLPKGSTITIAPKSQADLGVDYRSRFLHSAEATLLLVSRPANGAGGTTVAFSLQSRLTDLVSTVQVKQESPCYELEKLDLSVQSPYKGNGKFMVMLVESTSYLPFPDFQDEIAKLKHENYCRIGDFVYLIEGTGIPPLPSSFSPVDSPNVFPVNGSTNSKETYYLKCKENCILEENLKIPLVNERMEKALAIAAQMQMSLLEYERRKVTGTLESSSVRAALAASGVNREDVNLSFRSSSFSKKFNSIQYDVEISMPEHFEIPKQIFIPVSAKSRLPFGHASAKENKENGVSFPMKFVPEKPGRYPCKILLRSAHDVRVYMIECVVNPSSSETEFEFITSAGEALIQDIPISNVTEQDWKLRAILQGDRFYGPPFLYVPAGETVQYSLMFKPISKCFSTGKLMLQNETDGTEHIFGLKGIGQEPLALDHIMIDCQVRQVTQKVLMVPNYTNDRLTFKVVSDIPIIGGPQTITVKPGTSSPYTFSISPWKRGLFQGVISFVAEDREQQQFQYGNPPATTDGVDAEFQTADKKKAMKKTVGINIPITNPTKEVLHFHVLLAGDGVTGDYKFTLQPRETFPYVAKFSPTKTGVYSGSVIFQCDIFGEFWYELQMSSEKPAPIRVPEVACELGKWTRLSISLCNPTQETFELQTINTNPEHFLVEIDHSKPVLVPPSSTIEVPVQFCPSALGKGNHTSSIIFTNPQLEEWTFQVSGVGLIPQPLEPASISARVGSLASLIISFKNPTNEHVLVDVILTDQEQTMHRLSASVLRHSINKEPAFCLPLKQTQGIPLAPKERLDIPVLFAPETMKLYEALVVVHMVKANGDTWEHNNVEDFSTELKSVSKTEDGAIYGIRWIYPVRGIPEAQPSKSTPAVVSCQARNRTEERVEVLLTGVVPSQTAMTASAHDVKSTEKVGHIQEEVQVCNVQDCTEINSPIKKPSAQQFIQVCLMCMAFRYFPWHTNTGYPEPFSAYFLPGSDVEFSVLPQSGELLPIGTAGTLITVGFKPTMYSKKHKATLVVQTATMEWTYEINGVPPNTTPPTNVSSRICSMGIKQPTATQKRNFLRENLKLTSTAVSSPIKGASLIVRTT
uniref:Calponin-homology (CH) domain-containing protein n=1 Tax=Pyxicephalus adspersus TaxID=30357 RepID=A0AAV3AZ05_PYXAD|nr:TPA: hypothetical protein GDO54_000991 [Pyxicephalus adspersus]